MRLSVYISEAAKVNQLNDIIATVEKENPSHHITGVLSYNHGYYLQIVEGDSAEVKAFEKSIRKDARHQNIRKVLNFETTKRYFSCWSFNLAPLLKRNESFLAIVDHLNRNIDSVTFDKRRLFSIFHPLTESRAVSQEQINEHNPLVYSINEWPDFKALRATSSLMSLCGTLMRKPTCFRTIASQNPQVCEEELRQMLNQLNDAEYLNVTQMNNPTEVAVTKARKNVKRNEFIQLVERFGKTSFKAAIFQKSSA